MARRVLAVVAAFALAACTHTSAPAPTPLPTRVTGWQEDLRGLLPSLAPVHPDLADGVPAALTAELDALVAQAPALDDDALTVGVMRVLAHMTHGRDGHTGVFPWSNGNRPVHSLPLRLWFFSDGLYVEDGLGSPHDLVGARVTGIGGHPLDEVLRRLDPLVSDETSSTRLLLRPRYLLIPEVLHGLGLVDDVRTVTLDVVMPDAAARSVPVAAVPMETYNAWAGEYGLHLVARPGVRWMARTDEPLWHLVDGRVLYVAYNAVADSIDPAEVEALTGLARSAEIERIVVDVRHNTGGEVNGYLPLVPAFTDVRAPVFLLTGRNTFSAAALFAADLRVMARATIVGEVPSSGARSFGNATDITLGHTGLVLTVASTRETAADPATRVVPDRPVAMSYADWLAGRDPVYDAALR